MAKITKLEAGGRQLDSAIRMFFANEDILAVHTLSRAAFRILYDITKEGEAKVALDAHIKKVGVDRFNEETNFLKHADRDPDGEIDDNFHLFTEAGIGMAAGLYVHHTKKLTSEMRGFHIWGAMMRPKFFDVPDGLKKLADDWRANSATDPDKITEQKAARDFGAALVHWIKLRDAPKGTQWKPT
jgi:hypothetical protein